MFIGTLIITIISVWSMRDIVTQYEESKCAKSRD